MAVAGDPKIEIYPYGGMALNFRLKIAKVSNIGQILNRLCFGHRWLRVGVGLCLDLTLYLSHIPIFAQLPLLYNNFWFKKLYSKFNSIHANHNQYFYMTKNTLCAIVHIYFYLIKMRNFVWTIKLGRQKNAHIRYLNGWLIYYRTQSRLYIYIQKLYGKSLYI